MSTPHIDSIAGRAVAVLETADPAAKVALTHQASALWRAGELVSRRGDEKPPERPARPARPLLLAPRDMPKRSSGASRKGRIALLHALAHIELNAIDLAWDLIARFGQDALPDDFLADWVAVADDEARHFTLLSGRLAALGSEYGGLAAHDGLWQAARDTRHDILARLAVVPMVLEARGLDVTPGMAKRLRRNGDAQSAAIIETIYQDEIGHVGAGVKWFKWVCAERGLRPETTFQKLVKDNFLGLLKPPFNKDARFSVGLTVDYYGPLAVPRNRDSGTQAE